MNARVWLVAASLLLAACPNKDKDKDEDKDKDDKKESSNSSGSSNPTTSPTPAPVTTDGPTPPAGVEARVVTEVNNRKDGITGTAMTPAGAHASVQAPQGWTAPKNDATGVFSASQDGKARVAATAFTGDATTKLAAVGGTAGLTNCQWAAPQPVTVGKDSLPGVAADGTCARGAGQVKAAYVTAGDLAVIGSWDNDGDSNSVFGAMRSIAKASGPAGPDPVAACCAALRAQAKNAPLQQQPYYTMAAGACDGLRRDPNGRAQLATVRAMLKGAQVPAQCN